jgi:hypothetical protein
VPRYYALLAGKITHRLTVKGEGEGKNEGERRKEGRETNPEERGRWEKFEDTWEMLILISEMCEQ